MRRLAGAWFLACVLLAGNAPATSAAAPCPPLDYLAGLHRIETALSATPPDSAGAAALLQQMSTAYPAADPVLSQIQSDLQEAPPDVTGARARVSTIAKALALPPGSTCNADQRPARDELHRVYASPVFANLDRKPPGPNPVGQFLDWLGSLLRGMTRFLGTPGSIALGAAILAVALVLAAWRLRGVLGSREARLTDEPREEGVDPDRLWTLAARAAQRGEYREAIRRAFRSALLAVAVRGRLSVDPTWTTRELLAATRADAALLTALAPAAASFDRAWYSGAPVTASDWQEARTRCEAVRALARARPRVAAT